MTAGVLEQVALGQLGVFTSCGHAGRTDDQRNGRRFYRRHDLRSRREQGIAETSGTLSKTIHPYPTQGEAIKKVADAYMRTRLTPFVKALFSKWLSWTR